MKPLGSYNARIDEYYSDLVANLKAVDGVAIVAIAHMVPNALSFLPALHQLASLSVVLPKPKSENRSEHKTIKEQFRTESLDRNWAADADRVVSAFEEWNLNNQKLVLVDIGGYFAQSFDKVVARFSGKVIGILEGTENGLQKYEEASATWSPTLPPVITVARSPLKLPEDYLVASSVVFSIESVLREEAADILQTKRACVIGYGRVGSSVADILRGRGIPTDIFDTDPVKLSEAAARGYPAHQRLSEAVRGKTLLVCATGNKSLAGTDFDHLEDGCILASVTSGDDEFGFDGIEHKYTVSRLTDNIASYQLKGNPGKHFLTMANGNAVNFLHGAIIGPAMQLIEGEKLAAIKALVEYDEGETENEFVQLKSGIYELHRSSRQMVAETWNKHFL